jgi:hypothetical protein
LNLKNRLAPLVVFLIVAAAALATKSGPTYNFDNVFYLGVAERMLGHPIEEAHRSAYEQIRVALPPEDYQKILSDGTPDDLVRIPSANNVEAYRQQLPFYSVKPVYPLLIAGFRIFGVNGVIASLWISAVSLGLLAAMCCSWLGRYYSGAAAAVLSVLIALSAGVFNLGVDPRPDALYAAVVLGMLMLTVRTPRLSAALVALMLFSMLVRPDAIILCLLLCGAWMLLRPGEYGRPLVGIGLCVLLYMSVTRITGAYSWPVLMYHAYIAYQPYPETHPSAVHAVDLLHIYLKYGQPIYSQTFLTMLAVAVAALVASLLVEPLRSAPVACSAVLVLTLPLHFLVHPSDNMRVRSAYYVAALILLLIAVAKAARNVAPPVSRWLLAPQSAAATMQGARPVAD